MFHENLDPKQGLCSGTHLRLTYISQHILEACTVGGYFDGEARLISYLLHQSSLGKSTLNTYLQTVSNLTVLYRVLLCCFLLLLLIASEPSSSYLSFSIYRLISLPPLNSITRPSTPLHCNSAPFFLFI